MKNKLIPKDVWPILGIVSTALVFATLVSVKTLNDPSVKLTKASQIGNSGIFKKDA